MGISKLLLELLWGEARIDLSGYLSLVEDEARRSDGR